MNGTIRTWLLLLVVACVPLAGRGAPIILKFASLAPEGSAWMNVFEEARQEILKATGGEVQLRIYPGGVLGEEKDVLFKIKAGQLDGAGFIGYGSGRICPDARALMVPLLFQNYEEVDAVFTQMTPYLNEHCLANDFVALGWTEIGFSYLYSSQPVRSLRDLQGSKPWSVPNEPMLAELFKAGQISAIPVPVSDVLTALQTGLIQTTFSPALAAVAMQWYTKVKYRNDLRVSYTFGGLFISQKSWERVPETHRAIVQEICRKKMAALSLQVRKSNEDALRVIASSGVETVTSSAEETAQFQSVRDEALKALRDTVFSGKAMDMVQQQLDEFRRTRPVETHAP